MLFGNIAWPRKNARETEMLMDKYYMNLEFGKSKNGVISGKISLVIPAKHKISIAGDFVVLKNDVATLKRSQGSY